MGIKQTPEETRQKLIESLVAVPITPEQAARTADLLLANVVTLSVFQHSSPTAATFDFKEKLDTLAETFQDYGFKRQDFVQAALRQPQLFYRNPQTTIQNVKDLVAMFAVEGLTVKPYIAAAMKQPSLLTLASDTVDPKRVV